jgi:hypothetical protein
MLASRVEQARYHHKPHVVKAVSLRLLILMCFLGRTLQSKISMSSRRPGLTRRAQAGRRFSDIASGRPRAQVIIDEVAAAAFGWRNDIE